LRAELFAELGEDPPGAIAQAMHPGLRSQAGGPRRLRPQSAGQFRAAQAGAERGRFDPPDRSDKNSWPHPVIAGGKLYLRDQDVLLCYDVKAK